MGKFIYFLVLIGAFVYKFWWRPKVCDEKIRDRVKEIGGQVISIEQISLREELYSVIYTIKDRKEKVIVKFNLMYEQEWK